MDPNQPEKKPAEERVPIKSLRTYQGDVEEAMSKNKVSATTIFVAEEKKRREVPRVQERRANPETRNKIFTILGIVLLVLGIGIVFAVYYARSSQKVVIEQRTKTLVDFSQENDIAIASSTRDSVINKIVSETSTFKQPVNSILYLNTTDNAGNAEDVNLILSLLAPKMPAALQRSFENKYMIGVISYDTNAPFIILTTNDYASSYAGMLRWEKDMPSDLQKIFGVTLSGTTTPTFLDEALRNKDLRILKGADNKTALLYSFIDRNTLVITKNENVFNAILAKYLTSQTTH